jgi:hypothetical protein
VFGTYQRNPSISTQDIVTCTQGAQDKTGDNINTDKPSSRRIRSTTRPIAAMWLLLFIIVGSRGDEYYVNSHVLFGVRCGECGMRGGNKNISPGS